MNSPKNTTPSHESTGATLQALQQETRWALANDSEKAVLRRIALQRDRLTAQQSAHKQAKALRAQATAVSPDAPLIERVTTFARLHPVASAGLVGLALFLGPRKITRVAMTVLPLLAKLRR